MQCKKRGGDVSCDLFKDTSRQEVLMNIPCILYNTLSRDLFEENVDISERAPACEIYIILGVRASRVNKWK